eukprot:10337829-Prorocentrum_lima.AAC.1
MRPGAGGGKGIQGLWLGVGTVQVSWLNEQNGHRMPKCFGVYNFCGSPGNASQVLLPPDASIQ